MLLACALLVACADEPTSAAPEYTDFEVQQTLPTPLEAADLGLDWDAMHAAATSLRWRVVEAGGTVQAAACAGSGSPTVVYLDGLGSPAAVFWAHIAVQQSASTRTCVFDRPGVGLSPARGDATVTTDPGRHVEEMTALLAALGEPGPYVLVGWSYGGFVARIAAALTTQVAGLVLVDHLSPMTAGSDVLEEGADPGILHEADQLIDLRHVAQDVGSGPSLGDTPVVVLVRGERHPGEPAADWATWRHQQAQAASISTNAVHVVVTGSDHAIPVRNPAVILAATRAVTDSVRAGNSPLGPCFHGLSELSLSCS